MREFAAAGIPIEDVWAIATWKAADMLGRSDLGRIREGARASVIVFREDPSKALAALSTLEAVIVDGKLYRRAELARALTASRGRRSITRFCATIEAHSGRRLWERVVETPMLPSRGELSWMRLPNLCFRVFRGVPHLRFSNAPSNAIHSA